MDKRSKELVQNWILFTTLQAFLMVELVNHYAPVFIYNLVYLNSSRLAYPCHPYLPTLELDILNLLLKQCLKIKARLASLCRPRILVFVEL